VGFGFLYLGHCGGISASIYTVNISNKALKLSIIIPAYNEENHLVACLDSIAAQTEAPDEVIVVNNNSTDATVKIARRYSFVRLAHETQQGWTPARDKGFSLAHSDILGRIDADSIIARNWVQQVKQTMQDPAVGGVTGPAQSISWPHLRRPLTTLWSMMYFWDTRAYYRVPIMWGPNMAIRREAWLQIADQAAKADHEVHEDHDMSVLVAAAGWRIVLNPEQLIQTDGYRYIKLFKALEYAFRRAKTRHRHARMGTLKAARQNARINRPKSLVIRLSTWPFGLMFGLVCMEYGAYRWLLRTVRGRKIEL
jgi:glycosyltransferase involved in cell wall biosynthesis